MTGSNNTITTISFLDRLRSSTSVLHAQLEALPISKAIISPEITVMAYGNYLALMLDVVRDVETFVFPLLSDVLPDLENRRKKHFIENDLRVINHVPHSMPTEMNGTFSIPFALGILYVLEGSTLGGRFILKNVEQVLGFTAERGASYFTGYGNKTGSSWKSFLERMVEYEEENQGADEIIAGANFAFKSIHNHILKG